MNTFKFTIVWLLAFFLMMILSDVRAQQNVRCIDMKAYTLCTNLNTGQSWTITNNPPPIKF